MIQVSNQLGARMFSFDESTDFDPKALYIFRYNIRNYEGCRVTDDSKKTNPNVAVLLKWIKQRETEPCKGSYELCYEDLNGLQAIVGFRNLESLNNAIERQLIPENIEPLLGKINHRKYLKRFTK
jgi:hypothetical protein